MNKVTHLIYRKRITLSAGLRLNMESMEGRGIKTMHEGTQCLNPRGGDGGGSRNEIHSRRSNICQAAYHSTHLLTGSMKEGCLSF